REPCAALFKRQRAQIVLPIDQQIVCAKVRREFREHSGVYTLSIETLLQDIEALHAAIAHDEELAIDRGRKPECLDEIWKASGNVLTGARIEMGDEATVFVATGDGLNSNAVPFPLTHEIPWIERREITVFDGMRQHRRAKRCWIARDRLVGAAFKP